MTESEAERQQRITRNRQVLAERLHWPDGALERCFALEMKFPRWVVFWSAGGVLPRDAEPGYRASFPLHNHSIELWAETIEDLRKQVDAADCGLPSDELAPYRPLPAAETRCFGSVGTEGGGCGLREPHRDHPLGERPVVT